MVRETRTTAAATPFLVKGYKMQQKEEKRLELVLNLCPPKEQLSQPVPVIKTIKAYNNYL